MAELHRMGGPLAVRQVQRLLGVGWPRAKRLADMAAWTDPTANGHEVKAQSAAETETEPADHIDSRTNP